MLRSLLPLEVLDFALVSFRGFSSVERAEVAPFSRLRVDLARVEPVLTAAELANHGKRTASRVPIRRRSQDGRGFPPRVFHFGGSAQRSGLCRMLASLIHKLR